MSIVTVTAGTYKVLKLLHYKYDGKQKLNCTFSHFVLNTKFFPKH